MRKILFLVVIVAIVISFNVLTAGAQDTNSNTNEANLNVSATDNIEAGLLPDSPFYFLKAWWETIRETFTLRSESKLQYMEKLGEKRAVEAGKMIEKGKLEVAEKVMNRYNERLQKMENLIEKKGEQLDEKLNATQERIQNRFEHRNQVLQGVLDQAPEQARQGLQRALDNSKTQLQSLETRIQDRIQKRDQQNQRLRDRLDNQNVNEN